MKNCMNVTYKGKSQLDISIESYLLYAMTSIRLSWVETSIILMSLYAKSNAVNLT